MTKKLQFKGTAQTVTRWEKRWINVGHMKLLKWVPTKIKRPTPLASGTTRKDGTGSMMSTRQTPVSTNMETRQSRSSRRAGLAGAITGGGSGIGNGGGKEEADEQFNAMYLNSLPKTRRTAKKIDLLQKKHLQDAGITDGDLQPSSADEKTPIKTPNRKPPGRSKTVLSPNDKAAPSVIDSPGTTITVAAVTSTSVDTTNNNLNLVGSDGEQQPTNKNKESTLSSLGGGKDKSASSLLPESSKYTDDDDKMDEEDDSSSDDDNFTGANSVNDEDDEDDNENDKKNNTTTTTAITNNEESLNNNSLGDKMEFESLHNLDGGQNSFNY